MKTLLSATPHHPAYQVAATHTPKPSAAALPPAKPLPPTPSQLPSPPALVANAPNLACETPGLSAPVHSLPTAQPKPAGMRPRTGPRTVKDEKDGVKSLLKRYKDELDLEAKECPYVTGFGSVTGDGSSIGYKATRFCDWYDEPAAPDPKEQVKNSPAPTGLPPPAEQHQNTAGEQAPSSPSAPASIDSSVKDFDFDKAFDDAQEEWAQNFRAQQRAAAEQKAAAHPPRQAPQPLRPAAPSTVDRVSSPSAAASATPMPAPAGLDASKTTTAHLLKLSQSAATASIREKPLWRMLNAFLPRFLRRT